MNGDKGDFEDWEVEYELFSNKDFEGLVRNRKTIVEKYPKNIQLTYSLCDAYMLNEDFEKALEGFSILYKEDSENILIQQNILNCLFKLGKSENDFKWVKTPIIITLNKAVLNNCFEVLKGKRKPRSLDEIYQGLQGPEYLKFKEVELFKALKGDGRFEVRGEESRLWNVSIKNKKKK